jgi:thymidine phosphorylase
MKVKKGDLIAEIFTDKKQSVHEAKKKIENSMKVSNKKTAGLRVIRSMESD